MSEDPDAIDPRDNPEARTAEGSASQPVARSSAGGPIFSEAPPADSVPVRSAADGSDQGSDTGGGVPLDGVLIDPVDAEQAVPGDEGPEHPGRR